MKVKSELSFADARPLQQRGSHSRRHTWTPRSISKIILRRWIIERILLPTTSTMASDPTIQALRATLTDENAALAKRFRALFSLKHIAAQNPATTQTRPAIEAIAAAFTSPSALLKHELAYCLGQSGKSEAVPFLREVIEDRGEDAMCRHEAAEALGALSDVSSLELLRQRRDDTTEEEVVRETCDIAVERIEWENSEARRIEKLKQRYNLNISQNGLC